MNLSAIHKRTRARVYTNTVVCDIGGYEFVSYSQEVSANFGLPICCL